MVLIHNFCWTWAWEISPGTLLTFISFESTHMNKVNEIDLIGILNQVMYLLSTEIVTNHCKYYFLESHKCVLFWRSEVRNGSHGVKIKVYLGWIPSWIFLPSQASRRFRHSLDSGCLLLSVKSVMLGWVPLIIPFVWISHSASLFYLMDLC
jgi:hypothetical protein